MVCSYTLGGFFLANYDESPAGVFDEVGTYISFGSVFDFAIIVKVMQLVTNRTCPFIFSIQLVVIAGLVWSPPTSCAYVWLNFLLFCLY